MSSAELFAASSRQSAQAFSPRRPWPEAAFWIAHALHVGPAVEELDDLLHDRNGDRRLKARNATRAGSNTRQAQKGFRRSSCAARTSPDNRGGRLRRAS